MKIKTLVFIGLICLSIVSAEAQNVDITKLPTIQTTGTAEIQVVPDKATLSFAIIKKNNSIVIAKKENDETVVKVVELAKRFDISALDVKTDYIRISPETKRVKIKGSDDDYTEIPDGYRVARNLIITLRDIGKFETFLTALLEAGVNNVSEVVFSSSELRKYKDLARAQAIRAAKEKAEALAKEINQTIGKAVSIEESNDEPRINSNNNTRFSEEGYDGRTISVGTITVKAQVEVRFLLN